MRARVELSKTHVTAERVLAAIGALAVSIVLLGKPGMWPGRHAFFPAVLLPAVWLPRFARRGWVAEGEVVVGPNALVVRGDGVRKVDLDAVTGARAAAGRIGASVLVSLKRDGLLTIDLDDAADAAALARAIREAARVDATVQVRHARFSMVVAVLRVVATVAAVLYLLHVTYDLIPGAKALYGLSAIDAGCFLLAAHVGRHTPRSPLEVAALSDSSDHPASMRGHLKTHLERPALGHVEDLRLLPPDQPPERWLAETRQRIDPSDAYRGDADVHRQRLEEAFSSPTLRLEDRALALRLLARSDPDEVARRIDALPEGPDPLLLEAVALAETDAAAVAQLARHRPRFAPSRGSAVAPRDES